MHLVVVSESDNIGSLNRLKALAMKYKTTLYLGMDKEIPTLDKWDAIYIDLSIMGYNDRQRAYNALTDTLNLVMEIANTRMIDEISIIRYENKSYLRVWAD